MTQTYNGQYTVLRLFCLYSRLIPRCYRLGRAVVVETSRAFACIGPKWVSMRELQVKRDAFSTMVVKLLASCGSAGVQARKTIPNYHVSALPVAAGVRILSGAS